jgi:glutaredoxin
MIKIYTLPNCSHCDKAKKILKEKNIEYEEINLKEPKNREAREYYRSLGVKTAPIIVSLDDSRDGFKVKIDEKLMNERWIMTEYSDEALLKHLEDDEFWGLVKRYG